MLIPISSSSLAFEPQPQPTKKSWSQERIVRYIISIARRHHVNPALALSVAEIESSFNPRAIRREGHLNTASVGVFQVLHTTARNEFGFKGSIEELKNPAINISLGVRYLARCGGEEEDFLYLACCYQAGFAADPVFCATHPGVQNYRKKLEEKFAEWSLRI
jgi:hypothetical protein